MGDQLVLRLPRRPSAEAFLVKEAKLLPRLAGLPLAIPISRAHGKPSAAFLHAFAAVDWIESVSADQKPTADMGRAALDLAAFLATLQAHDTTGSPLAGEANYRRGVPLADLTAEVDRCVSALSDEIDATAARQLWHHALEAVNTTIADRLLHGDLRADNLLIRGGCLAAVLDWDLAAVGDGAVDLSVARTSFDPDATEAFQGAHDAPDQSWARA